MRDECLTCSCNFTTGCKYDAPEPPKRRAYVMKKPRGPRGPNMTMTRKSLNQRTTNDEPRTNSKL